MIDYAEYLASAKWRKVRQLALERAGQKCQICGSKNSLDVHHNTYDHLGNEDEHLEDLVVLCADHHHLYHDALAEVERHSDRRLEETFIGALLQESVEFVGSVSYLSADVFTSSLCREIFNYVLRRAAKGQETDAAIAISYLTGQRLLCEQEAEEFVDRCINYCSQQGNLSDYAELLNVLYFRRLMQLLPAKITTLVRNSVGMSITEMVDALETQVQSITALDKSQSLTSIADGLLYAFQDIEARNQGKSLPSGVSCNFYDLDAMTGGLQPSDLIIVAGRPGMGKTSFTLGLVHNIARLHKLPVLVFSMEMSQEQMLQRLVSCEAGIESQRLRTGRIAQNEWELLSHAITELSELPIFIDDTPALTVAEFRSKARRLQMQHGKLGLIVLDYLQLMGDGISANRVQELSQITRLLKITAKELEVPLIAASQLSRSVETRNSKRPMLSDLRESGSIEQDADLVLMLYRDSYYNPDSPDRNVAEIILAKHRNGPTGTIKMLFDPNLTKFVNLARLNY